VPPTAVPALANTTTAFSQYDPDLIWTGSQLVVAWVDTSNAATEPDLRFRTFDGDFNPTSGEQTLAGTPDSEADVALAPFAGSWAAAWRDDSTAVDASGLETVQVVAGTTAWSVGLFLPAPVAAKPALTALDTTHLLVVYTVGVDDNDSGVANGSQIYAAVLSTTSSGAVAGTPIPAVVTTALGLDQSTPAAATVQGSVFISWWTAGALGDPNGEELWLKSVTWNGSSLGLGASEVSLPRWPQARSGDQEAPALAASTLPPGGALITGWNDLGRAVASGEGTADVVVESMPVPLLRTPGDGGP
jgi:hypothetical protein